MFTSFHMFVWYYRKAGIDYTMQCNALKRFSTIDCLWWITSRKTTNIHDLTQYMHNEITNIISEAVSLLACSFFFTTYFLIINYLLEIVYFISTVNKNQTLIMFSCNFNQTKRGMVACLCTQQKSRIGKKLLQEQL